MSGLPEVKNGADAVVVLVSGKSPVLLTKNDIVFVSPMVTEPKSRLPGLTARCGGLTARIRFACVFVLTPTGPLAIRRTVFVPATVYVCVKFVAAVVSVPPSPKLQNRLLIVPVELSVNETINGIA